MEFRLLSSEPTRKIGFRLPETAEKPQARTSIITPHWILSFLNHSPVSRSYSTPLLPLFYRTTTPNEWQVTLVFWTSFFLVTPPFSKLFLQFHSCISHQPIQDNKVQNQMNTDISQWCLLYWSHYHDIETLSNNTWSLLNISRIKSKTV